MRVRACVRACVHICAHVRGYPSDAADPHGSRPVTHARPTRVGPARSDPAQPAEICRMQGWIQAVLTPSSGELAQTNEGPLSFPVHNNKKTHLAPSNRPGQRRSRTFPSAAAALWITLHVAITVLLMAHSTSIHENFNSLLKDAVSVLPGPGARAGCPVRAP